MSTSWLDELLPQGMVTPRTRVYWALFFLLFPLAYVGGALLERSAESPARMMGYEDRTTAIKRAAAFAAEKGFDVGTWHRYLIVETRDKLLRYYGDEKTTELRAASFLAPAREVNVLFRSPDQKHEFRVYLSLPGQVTGYDFGKTITAAHITSRIGILSVQTNNTSAPEDDQSSMKNATRPSDIEAESIARQVLAQDGTLSSLVQLGKTEVDTNADDPARKEVSWDATTPKLKALTLHVSVSVRDGQVVAQHIEGKVDSDYSIPKPKFPIFLESCYSVFLTFGAFYAMFRYAKRTLQKEVSHLRTLVVAALFSASYSLYIYSIAVDEVASRVSGEQFSKIAIVSYVTGAVVFALMGLLVGLGYGSGEGEVREAYPGKLTSLDALLAGRLFSRNVAASLLFGVAAAGWLLLCHRAISYFLQGDLVATRNDVLSYTFSRLPWLTLLVGKQYDALLIAVTGLLLPGAFLVRSAVKKKRRFVWLIAFALLAVMQDASRYETVPAGLLAMVILTCGLLLPFFAFDLLAAVVSLSALAFVDELVRLSSVFPSWTGLVEWLAALGIVSLGVATYLALRGRSVREEDVRPLYARNLAERMSLQAEVLAAREAQLRLLPQSPPDLPGVQFAACCLPARGVGGDFYDFFRLDPQRVGIFVAQGGDQGLASALCIALAKGVLMHASLQPHSPTQVVVDLEASLAELLYGTSGKGISFAYGVMDTRKNALSYARIGTSPRFTVFREGAPLAATQLESVVIAPDRPKEAAPIFEGTVHGRLGDLLVFFTHGVTSLRAKRFGKREYQWLELLRREMTRAEETLQVSLLKALGKFQSHAPADLTAVVLRLEEVHIVANEVVA
jgi:serine phosphatase RsbU (regulator of sigma subunit)